MASIVDLCQRISAACAGNVSESAKRLRGEKKKPEDEFSHPSLPSMSDIQKAASHPTRQIRSRFSFRSNHPLQSTYFAASRRTLSLRPIPWWLMPAGLGAGNSDGPGIAPIVKRILFSSYDAVPNMGRHSPRFKCRYSRGHASRNRLHSCWVDRCSRGLDRVPKCSASRRWPSVTFAGGVQQANSAADANTRCCAVLG